MLPAIIRICPNVILTEFEYASINFGLRPVCMLTFRSLWPASPSHRRIHEIYSCPVNPAMGRCLTFIAHKIKSIMYMGKMNKILKKSFNFFLLRHSYKSLILSYFKKSSSDHFSFYAASLFTVRNSHPETPFNFAYIDTQFS